MAKSLALLESTKIALQRSGARSLKTTIPKRIVQEFRMSLGDELVWQLLVDHAHPQKKEIRLIHHTAKSNEEFATAMSYDMAKTLVEITKQMSSAKGNKNLERLIKDMDGILEEINPYKSNGTFK